MTKTVSCPLLPAGIALALLMCAVSLRAQDPLASAMIARDSGDIVGAARILDGALAASPGDFNLLMAAGLLRLNYMEDYPAAVDLFSRALSEKRKDPAALRGLGTAQSMVGRCSEAIETLQGAVSVEKSLDSYLALGNAYLRCGKDSLSRAELTFQTANNAFPKNARVAIALGDLYFSREIYELAESKYSEALNIDGQLIEPRIRLARANRELAKQQSTLEEAQPYYRKALHEFNQVTLRAPHEPLPWREQGEILMLAEEWESALKSFERYRQLRPDDPRADTLLASAAIRGNFYQYAIDPLQKALGRSDSISLRFRPRALFMLGKGYYAMKNFDSSRIIYSQISDSAMAADLESAKLYASAIMQSGGDTIKALSLYEKLSAANPEDCELATALGDLLYKMKRYDGVIVAFNRRLQYCADKPTALPLLYIGLAHFAKKNYSAAVESLRRSADADTTSATALYWLMNAYAIQKQYGKAGSLATELIARNAEAENPRWVAQAWFYSGKDRFDAKKFKEAISLFEKAHDADRTYCTALLFIAYAYQSSNDKANACKYYKLVVQCGGDDARSAREEMRKIGCE